MIGLAGEQIIQLAILMPLVASVLIVLAGKKPNLREAITLITAVMVALLVMILAGQVNAGERPSFDVFEVIPGINISFSVEPLGMLFALVASILWLVTSIYAIGYMRGHHEKNQTRFYAAFAIAIASTLAAAFSGNMFTLFLCYEILTLSTYPLVTHAGTKEARRSGRIYLGILLGTSIGFQLLAILLTWSVTGTLDFKDGGILAGKLDPAYAGILYALFVFGVGKAAIMPFHKWLPAAMVAPTPVSALLHAVAVVKTGVFAILKVTIYIFGSDFITSSGAGDWLIWFAAVTILLSSLIAMTKDNLKARLAYSTISQLSYIVLGALVAVEMSLIGASMHIAMHAFAKITLFFAAGAILVAAHKKDISDMDGLGRVMPITFAAFTIGSLSIIGLPPFGGMWSKWYLALGMVQTEQWVLLTVLMLSSLLNIAYLLPISVRAFFAKPKEGVVYTQIKEAPISMLMAIGFTSLACIVLFFYSDPFYNLAVDAATGR
ncbi:MULTISPECIES: monovalent cation/H+ antiporter subunit D family protein [Cycloclasticus]|uniref:NADH dehydrogenase n=1 Tax=Cycloclasticus pugetii TaxID=34068 RepID=A0AB33Z424_9GAMM|nr:MULTISPECIES: monovalent cation/H+ antiporter subunit D family protein [Cycloclasticus]ATI03524.1 monovalent cation/H+ antiporter subunit D family protein [Cycloclasticus sp. PY97N]EPD14008.1 NADH dehydrogenase [Cycloclasticus pugetii]